MKPVLLVLIKMPDADLRSLRDTFDVRHAPDAASRAAAVANGARASGSC